MRGPVRVCNERRALQRRRRSAQRSRKGTAVQSHAGRRGAFARRRRRVRHGWLWRGIWLCIDDILFPDSRWRSATAGLGIGVALYLALAWLRPRGAAAALRRPGLAWFLDACYSYVGVWVSVLVWRGFWYLGDGLFARDAAVSHACGFFALLGFGALRSACAAPMFLVADAAPPLFSALAWDDLAAFDPRRRLAPPPTDARSPNGA